MTEAQRIVELEAASTVARGSDHDRMVYFGGSCRAPSAFAVLSATRSAGGGRIRFGWNCSSVAMR